MAEQRKVIVIKKFMVPESREVEESVWFGKCPECGVQQNGYCKSKVDTLCSNCYKNIHTIKKREIKKQFTGAIIEDIIWDDGEDYDCIDVIIITTPNGATFKIEACDDCMEII